MEKEDETMLRYAGHPLVDVGVATIAAFVHKRDPSLVTEADLDEVAGFLAENYIVNPLKSFLTVAFPNSGFTNPALEKTPERRQEYARRILYAWREGFPLSADRCVFTGSPAAGAAFALPDKPLPPGKGYRQHVPLFTGEGVINFSPGGDAGLPISGLALLCIHALPLGCAKCRGRLLAVHSDSPELMVEFASKLLQDNLRALDLAKAKQSSKLPEAKAGAKTLLIETLLSAEEKRWMQTEARRPASVTAYHFSNLGATPSLDIYHLPLELTEFLAWVASPDYRDEWHGLAGRAWRLTKRKKGKEVKELADSDEDSRPRQNVLYEDLFGLPENAQRFVRRYFVRNPLRTRFDDDPRRTYSLRDEADLVSWHLTELFLKKVMRMDKDRIQEIRNLGDRLATHVLQDNGKRFFRGLFENRYDYFRMNLIRASLNAVQQGQAPLVTFDPYIAVFEDGEEVSRTDWRLARDLVLIRVVEQLHQQGWLRNNPDAVPEPRPEEQAESESADTAD